MLGLERKGCTLYVAHFIQGPASAPQIFEAPFATEGGWCLVCSGRCAARLEPGEAGGRAGGTAEAWRFGSSQIRIFGASQICAGQAARLKYCLEKKTDCNFAVLICKRAL